MREEESDREGVGGGGREQEREFKSQGRREGEEKVEGILLLEEM